MSPFDRVSLHANLGETYRHLGDLRLAMEHLREAAELSRELGNWGHLGAILGNIADVQREMGDFTSAIQQRRTANQVIALTRMRGEHTAGLIELAITYAAAGEPQLAEETLKQALAQSLEDRERHLEARARLLLGRLAAACNPAIARRHLEIAIVILRDLVPSEADAARAELAALDPDEVSASPMT